MANNLVLVLMCKDEAPIIRRALESVVPFISYWVVHDTGSTDGTQDIVRETLKDIPGILIDNEWRNYGVNRSELIAHARAVQPDSYLILMDADNELIAPLGIPPLTADAYELRYTGDFSYTQTRIIKASLPWKYVGVTHEYLHADGAAAPVELALVQIKDHCTGSNRKDKFRRDILMLTEGLIDEPHNSRYMFYLAQSYRDQGLLHFAEMFYLKRVGMGGWDEEVYVSLLEAGRAAVKLSRYAEAWGFFADATESRPNRAEAWYERLRLANDHHRPEIARGIVEELRDFTPNRTHRLFVQQDIIDRWMPYEIERAETLAA
jgi:glycosyltransferase involved in cell wall biosynthesis